MRASGPVHSGVTCLPDCRPQVQRVAHLHRSVDHSRLPVLPVTCKLTRAPGAAVFCSATSRRIPWAYSGIHSRARGPHALKGRSAGLRTPAGPRLSTCVCIWCSRRGARGTLGGALGRCGCPYPSSSGCVAKEWHWVWGVARFTTPARRTAPFTTCRTREGGACAARRPRGALVGQEASGGLRSNQGRARSSWPPRRKSVASSP
jgi:hypothetical protein